MLSDLLPTLLVFVPFAICGFLQYLNHRKHVRLMNDRIAWRAEKQARRDRLA